MASNAPRIFGVIVSGRPVQVDFEQVGEKEFVIEVADAGSINHIVIFMTGVFPFPENMGGSVYIRWPSFGVQTNWHYLGFISNDKPSAFFRVAQFNRAGTSSDGLLFNSPMSSSVAGGAQIGISVEPLSQIMAKIKTNETTSDQQSAPIQFAEKMLQNFINYMHSFAVSMPRLDNSKEVADYIPASAIQNWYTNFSRRLQQNPDFWRSLS